MFRIKNVKTDLKGEDDSQKDDVVWATDAQQVPELYQTCQTTEGFFIVHFSSAHNVYCVK